MLVIAHRTPPSIEGCAALMRRGARVFEVDLQVIGGEIVVSHFLPLSRLVPRLRHDRHRLTVRRRLRHERDLATMVSFLPAGAELLLDLKNDHGVKGHALTDLVLAAGLDRDRCYASAKNRSALHPLRRAGLRTWTSVATRSELAAVLRTGADGDHAVTVRHSMLTPATLGRLREVSERVVAWTVNDVGRAQELVRLGVDGITSDSPHVFSRVASDGRVSG